ncbi:MAG: YqiA/YcfP family alpha/beta fold hydrolase [Leptolyngbyaceae bacterium]|nr:YqiA/YcfP family alpha/beta fold hydrolase [Leptolyngbyaceae bacterium]
MTHRFIYLHGFASSPQSFKARYFVRKFEQMGQPLLVPDLNQHSFFELTLTRQIQYIQDLMLQDPLPKAVIGSSLGGLTATWLAERCDLVTKLVLLAPAFNFMHYWLPKLGRPTLENWQHTGKLSVYHHGYQGFSDLGYSFLQDIQQYDDATLCRNIPTLIIHGRHDEVIPVEASKQFAGDRPWVHLQEVNSDHNLSNVTEFMWQSMSNFLEIDPEN